MYPLYPFCVAAAVVVVVDVGIVINSTRQFDWYALQSLKLDISGRKMPAYSTLFHFFAFHGVIGIRMWYVGRMETFASYSISSTFHGIRCSECSPHFMVRIYIHCTNLQAFRSALSHTKGKKWVHFN